MIEKYRCLICGAVLPTDVLFTRHMLRTHQHQMNEIVAQREAYEADREELEGEEGQ